VKYAVVWTENALRSLSDVIAYIAQRDGRAASRLVDRIDRRVVALATLPRTGKRYPRSGDTNIRQVVVAPYVVVYRVDEAERGVTVLMVRHVRQRQLKPEDLE